MLVTAIIVFLLDLAFRSIDEFGVQKLKNVVSTQTTNTIDANTTSEDTNNAESTDSNSTNATDTNMLQLKMQM